MSTKLSVVRHRVNPERISFEDSQYNTEYYLTHYTRDELEESLNDAHDAYVEDGGKYIKSGGGKPTDNLQEAQLFGWSRAAKENLKRYDSRYYEIIPVTISLAI